MIGGLLAWWIGLGRRMLHLPHQRGKGPAVTREIMQLFEAGCAGGLRQEARATSNRAIESLEWSQRSYFCEGRAMGLAARCALGRRRTNPEALYKDQAYQVARLIGYGFWNGVASRYPVPALRTDATFWHDVPRWDELKPLLANGASYGRVLMRGRLDETALAKIRAMTDAEDRGAALHGAGRALWLLYMYNFEALRDVFAGIGPERDSVASGVGFAIGFIHAPFAGEIPTMLDEFGALRPALLRGAGTALAVHRENDPESCREVTGRLTPELRESADAALRQAAGLIRLSCPR
jgi:hypothetical protein